MGRIITTVDVHDIAESGFAKKIDILVDTGASHVQGVSRGMAAGDRPGGEVHRHRRARQAVAQPVRHGTGSRLLRDARQWKARLAPVPRVDVEHHAVRDDRLFPFSGWRSFQRELAFQVVRSCGKRGFGQLVHGDDDPIEDRLADTAGCPLIEESEEK